MAENKRFRDSATPEERGIVLERLKNNETSAAIAFDMGLTLKVVCDIRNDALERGEITLEPAKLSTDAMRQLFTRGDSEQYSRMFDKLREGFPLHDIATIIWVCSDTAKHADEIENDLRARCE